MNKKGFVISASIAVLVLLITAVTAWHNDSALAKGQAKTPKVDAKTIMAKYSPPKSKNKTEATQQVVRRSRLSEMNVVSEAAKALDMLPIEIMDEMKKGKTLGQVAKSKGLTKAQFLKKLKDVEDQIVGTAVKAGTITEEHAAALKEGQKDRLTKSLDMKAVNVNDHMSMDMGN